MASIDGVRLSIEFPDKENASIDVRYSITFDKHDTGERYFELCRMIGDDTGVGDPAAAGGDDALMYLAPLFYAEFDVNEPKTVSRHFAKTVPVHLLDEDYGPIPDADELRALVSLTPVPPTHNKPVARESNLVRRVISS